MIGKPLIGLNADFASAQGNKPSYSYLTAGYFDSIIRAGGLPVIVPPQKDDADIQAILEKLDGFVMVGGNDLDPHRDGFERHSSLKMMDPARESFDRLLMRCIIDSRTPLFAIGVGMQLLNVAMGGNLFFHIPTDLPNAIPHFDPQDRGHRHSLEVSPGSLMERVYGEGEIRVSSRHHMALDEVAQGFAVTARCPDGVVEAIESDMADWFAIGTQFRPENQAASALDVRIFEEFLEGIKQNSAPMLKVVA